MCGMCPTSSTSRVSAASSSRIHSMRIFGAQSAHHAEIRERTADAEKRFGRLPRAQLAAVPDDVRVGCRDRARCAAS